MGIALSILLTLFGHLMNPGHSLANQTTVQADVTIEPSVTPSVTPEETTTPTETVTPTVTVTPSVSPVPTGDGDKDDMLGLKADAHAFFGLMNAAFHHEQNEKRFEQKHGVSVDTESGE